MTDPAQDKARLQYSVVCDPEKWEQPPQDQLAKLFTDQDAQNVRRSAAELLRTGTTCKTPSAALEAARRYWRQDEKEFQAGVDR